MPGVNVIINGNRGWKSSNEKKKKYSNSNSNNNKMKPFKKKKGLGELETGLETRIEEFNRSRNSD